LATETIHTDVLIVGSGGAASRAAYEAKLAEPDIDVLVATDGEWGGGGSTFWVASETLGINAPFNMAGDGDSPEVCLKDTLETGLGLASASLASRIAFEACDRVLDLVRLGVQFDSADGHFTQRKLSGCTKARSLSIGGRTGIDIGLALKRASISKGVKVLEQTRLMELIVEDGEVWGARGLRNGNLVSVFAGAVLLANGGAGAIFPHNINHPSLRGDGYAMAYRAGAKLTNLEFYQIGPGVVFPPIPFIIHSHMWRLSPRLRNAQGEEFLENYLPEGTHKDEVLSLKAMSFPFSVRTAAKYVDISMFREIAEGRGTVHGGLFFDVNHVPEKELREKAPITYETFLKAGVDLCAQVIEIAPLVQNFNGGVRIDENGSTGVKGLYAAGEVSGGVHGADRPGGNNLIDCQVFGYRGGRAAAVFAAGRSGHSGKPLDKELGIDRTKVDLAPIKAKIDKALMVIRDRKGLSDLLSDIGTARDSNPGLDIETENFLLVTEMLARSALFREESRGSHYRQDFPQTRAEFSKPSLLYKGRAGDMECGLA
jgi:succinate dehydrogenase/fumarate reductase flavoprotein subunit